ncbi:preprotein translocase subunit YajC [Helicobacter sp. MIT 01-3238]|uniref:preprotein translocase subunit YajC n=1 Tax=Helicobacter sp. MIT 01-3238 TaxID=398627 RepID=UPI000E1F5057|nr:preprotein translocase subunit YajC [Helicobacter sp. MIT 01-3238]RDU52242.1 preprotein translocase subunit YajC [Helicobacter sp. MIT 01-3238]
MGSNFGEIFQALIPFIVLFAVFYFLLIRPQRTQAKRHREMIESLKKGDKIVSTGGFVCEVIKVEDTFFSVRLSDDSTARLSKDFVSFKVDDSAESSSTQPKK